jgi:catechol 2,3-dioxygenase-like lactoylglutathione lyase family enzyme
MGTVFGWARASFLTVAGGDALLMRLWTPRKQPRTTGEARHSMSTSTSTSASLPGPDAPASLRPAHHAHAMMHCNLNTTAIERSAAFHMAVFDLEPRMRSVSNGVDATSMGLSDDIASVTTFLYDLRGPRAAPALELVSWSRPPTEQVRPEHRPSGFTAVGYRVASLGIIKARLAAMGIASVPVPGGLPVRGETRPALRITDPDGVIFEVVEIAPAAADPRRVALLSHERMRCTDLDRTVCWYEKIGWRVRDRGTGPGGAPAASLLLPEDPTFSLEFEQLAVPAGATRPQAANTRGLYRIALAVDDVLAASASLAAESGVDGAFGRPLTPVTLSMPDVPTGGFTVLFLADPDGAVVELVERPRSAVRRPAEPS